jgi:hypothetical protein
MSGWLRTTGPRPRSRCAIEYSVSTLGATTVRLDGLAKRVALLSALTGALPLVSGQGTLVAVRRTRRTSSSGNP